MREGKRGLVLGGGGITGIAWEVGLLAGLAELGVDLRSADVIVGTSAGSIVGVQITSERTMPELYERQLGPPDTGPTASLGLTQLAAYGVALARSRGDLTAFGRRLGAMSLRAQRAGRVPTLQQRYEAITERLPTLEWPRRDLRITAVDAYTGAFQVFGRGDGVALLDAVTASCAVPAVYPPVPIGGRTYIDGGVRTNANPDVAMGCARLVVLTPTTGSYPFIPKTDDQVAELGVPSTVIRPDAAAVAAIGKNVLDSRARASTARAGYAQARSVAEQIRAVWN